MSKSRRNIFFMLVLLVVVLCVWIYVNIEWVEKEIDLGPGAEIQRQDFIAAHRFLEKLDVELHVEKGFTRLDAPVLNSDNEQTKTFPSTDDLIVIGDGYAALSESRAAKLLDWVDAGGGLIVTATNPFLSSTHERPDYVFNELGVFPVTAYDFEDEVKLDESVDAPDTETDTHENSKDEVSDTKPWNPQSLCSNLTDNLFLTIADNVDVEIGLHTSQALSFDEKNEDNFFFWTSNDLGIQIIQSQYGSGVITFLSNIDVWKNDYIACFDNAYSLRFFAGNYEQVWFLVNTDSPSLIDLVWEKYPYLLLTFFMLLTLSVWHFGQRFGGIKPQRPLNRRRILEHIEASSLFLWRQKSTRWLLVDAVQHSIRKKMRIRNATFDNKTWLEQCEMISKTTQLPFHEVKASMIELGEDLKSQTLTEQNFIILMKSLKRIEGKL